jgi:cytochrome c peroxidase
MKTEAEVLGVPKSIKEDKVDDDLGEYSIIKLNALKHAFKIPTIRNAAQTAPYMHNGVYTSLKHVVDFYNKGGGAGLGFKLNNQTLSSDKLNLTAEESSALIAFIKSLNSL